MEKLIAEIIKDLVLELDICSDNEKSNLVTSKVKAAAREIKRDRNYPSHYSDEMIARDLDDYYSNIRSLALYDYNQVGAEGQTSHSDNGISRTWEPRSSCKDGVVAICRI